MNTLTNQTEALVRLKIRDAFHAASIHFGAWRYLGDSCTTAEVEVASAQLDAILAALDEAEFAAAELAAIESASEAAVQAASGATVGVNMLRETATLLSAQLGWASEIAA